MNWNNAEEIKSCLSSCGCREDDIRQFISVVQAGTKKEQLCWLKRHRMLLMNQIHETQGHVDCIDFIIRSLEQGTGGTK